MPSRPSRDRSCRPSTTTSRRGGGAVVVALVGDAAVVVRPHTAMGAAKAAGDAMALVDLLGTELSLADALATYDRDRLPVGRAIARYGQELGDSLPL
ncbi:FAD-dependent monooxygenase [Microbacterium hominis]|uniref:FAD-dependent monooxygenase n=1 Tax=Microbacterium hominis TaxID=162426 RepID=UPI0018D2106B|nr:FAD-dependent monooxygenase [Microbacterium hominis]